MFTHNWTLISASDIHARQLHFHSSEGQYQSSQSVLGKQIHRIREADTTYMQGKNTSYKKNPTLWDIKPIKLVYF